jgi:predicted dehydrogenase
LLLDLGSHQVDEALYLLGPAVSVYAEADRRRPGVGVEDDVMLALTHAGGARSTHWLSATAAHAGPRLRLLGSRAAYVVQGLDGQEDALRAGQRPGEGWGEVPETDWGVLAAGEDTTRVPSMPGDYRLFYRGLLDALRDGGPPPVTPADALDVLRVLDAARSSARTRQVVSAGP